MSKVLLLLVVPFFGSCLSSSTPSYQGHGADSLAKEVLERFSPPAVPYARLAKIENMLDSFPPIPQWISGDGKELFFDWSVTGVRHVWKMKKGEFPQQITGGQDKTILKDVTKDEKYLIFSRDERGNEYSGLYLMEIKSGNVTEIAKKNKVQFLFEFSTEDSKYIYYRANDKVSNGYSFYKYEVKTGQTSLVFDAGEGYWYIADHFVDGSFLLGKAENNIYSEYYFFNEKEKELKPILNKVDEDLIELAKFGESSSELILLTNKFSDFKKLYRYNILSQKFYPLTMNEGRDITSFSLDKSKKKIYITYNDQGYFTGEVRDLKTNKILNWPQRKSAEIYHQTIHPLSRNGRYALIKVVTYNSPVTSYIYDWKTRKKTQWLRPSSPEIEMSSFTLASLESYPARDGSNIPMFVYRPKECEKKEALCPVIVQFHGGPEGQSIPNIFPLRELLLEQGFIWVSPNVRGSDGYGKKYLEADNGAKRLQVITDIEDVALYIRKNWSSEGQSPKVGIYGGSYGGYVAYMGMTRFAGAYDAGISLVGISNLISFLNNTAPYRRKLRISEYGDPEKDREALIKLSPITYIDKIKAPLLIVHGATDPRVPAGEAIVFYEEMQKKNIPGELILFSDEGHGVAKRKNIALFYAYFIDFFNSHLK